MTIKNHFETTLEDSDQELFAVCEKEFARQKNHLELIASENYASRGILQAMGSVLTNKYAEGYPGKRYYGGCEYVDMAEDLARERAKKLFQVGDFIPHVNVQSHSGAQANQAVFLAFLNPGDKYLACSLDHGGHLTHGSPVNLSGKWFEAHHYGVSQESETIDMSALREQAKKVKPKLIIAGYSAYSQILNFEEFRSIADEVGALLMVDMAHFSGLVAAGEHPSPFPHAHVVTSTTHKTLRGPRSGMILCHADFAKKIDSALFPGLQGGPLMHVVAAKALCFKEALNPDFKIYIQNVKKNADAMACALKEKGYRIVSGGTKNHLFLVDLTAQEISGKKAEKALDASAINANRNTIPFDTKSPFVTSGIRLGTAALTTRGMGVEDMLQVAEFIDMAISQSHRPESLSELKNKVMDWSSQFPIYGASHG